MAVHRDGLVVYPEYPSDRVDVKKWVEGEQQ